MMAALRIADHTLRFAVASTAPRPVHDLITRISEPDDSGRPATHVIEVRGAQRPRLAVDIPSRHILLEVPSADTVPGGALTLQIAVLQAAARCLAMMSGALPLLHGGAITLDRGRSAIAVLDGGRGQGKTSLALGLARHGGQVLIDEFTFAVFGGDQPAVLPLPRFPWHVRADMAQVLAPGSTQRLLYSEDLVPLAQANRQPVPVKLILVPDNSVPAGQVRSVNRRSERELLRPAVTDHGEKLRTPALDHVSLFTCQEDVTIVGELGEVPGEHTLDALASIPVVRVGIGRPHQLPVTVAAVFNQLAEVE